MVLIAFKENFKKYHQKLNSIFYKKHDKIDSKSTQEVKY